MKEAFFKQWKKRLANIAMHENLEKVQKFCNDYKINVIKSEIMDDFVRKELCKTAGGGREVDGIEDSKYISR